MRAASTYSANAIDVVLIGASAGGVEALGAILPQLPSAFRPALVAVMHLPPDRPSLLPEIFGPRCAIPVKEAEDKEPIAAGTIYFAPPGYHLQIESDRTFVLSADDPVQFSRPSIDVLFETASWVLGSSALGILLTGANADGARGIQALHRAGAATWIQDPRTAMVTTMPEAALSLTPSSEVMTLAQIAARLTEMKEG